VFRHVRRFPAWDFMPGIVSAYEAMRYWDSASRRSLSLYVHPVPVKAIAFPTKRPSEGGLAGPEQRRISSGFR
jgi:hypothetical protein